MLQKKESFMTKLKVFLFSIERFLINVIFFFRFKNTIKLNIINFDNTVLVLAVCTLARMFNEWPHHSKLAGRIAWLYSLMIVSIQAKLSEKSQMLQLIRRLSHCVQLANAIGRALSS